jgi:hypothetical protein
MHRAYHTYPGPGDRYPSDDPPCWECQKCGAEFDEKLDECKKCGGDELERIQ